MLLLTYKNTMYDLNIALKIEIRHFVKKCSFKRVRQRISYTNKQCNRYNRAHFIELMKRGGLFIPDKMLYFKVSCIDLE